MTFKFKIEKFRKEDCVARVLYSSTGLNDRRKNITIPSNILKKQTSDSLRRLIVQNAPIREWEEESSMKDVSQKSVEVTEMLDAGVEFDVIDEEYQTITSFSEEVALDYISKHKPKK